MRFPFALLGLAQLPLKPLQPSAATYEMGTQNDNFALKEGAQVFSPKNLIELGRPGTAVSNGPGDLVLIPFSKFSFEDKKEKESIFVVSLDSKDKMIEIPLEKGGSTFWLTSRSIANAVDAANGTEIYVFDVSLDSIASDSDNDTKPYTSPALIGTIPTKSGNFIYNEQTGKLVFSAYVYPNGDLSSVVEKDEEMKNRVYNAYVYDETYVRHWDQWQELKRQQLFSVQLTKQVEGLWAFSQEFYGPLKGTKHYCPVEPFGGTDDFDVSNTHIVYTVKAPDLPEAWHTKQNVYLVPIDGEEKPIELTSGKQGAIHSPIFNNKGTKVAWLELDLDGYESDRAKVVIYDLDKKVRFTITQDWDRSPSAIVFSKDDSIIYLTVGDEAKIKIFALPVPPTPSHSTTHPQLDLRFKSPVSITNAKAASGVQPLSGGRLLFSQSSLTSPNDAFIIHNLIDFEEAVTAGATDASAKLKIEQITHLTEADLKDKYLDAGEEFWFKGADHKKVHGWAMKPNGWRKGDKKTWPVVLLIHGGPQGAWEDQWSTRWNPNIFTNQGYFIIAINPTGSTTFGQEFTDAIAGDWGGKPFTDMIHGWKYALSTYPEIDADRAVAAGASWGGYAVNWIQSNPEFGFGFKALACHDGVFDTKYNGFSTDELFFFNHEFGGTPWNPTFENKFNPSELVSKWSIPELIIHGSKDFRIPETEGIGAFHALQELGVPSRLVIFPEENHWVLKHGNSLKWHYEIFKWFDQFVGKI